MNDPDDRMYATWEEGDVIELGFGLYDMYDESRVLAQLSREQARSLFEELRRLLEPPEIASDLFDLI